MHNHLICDSPNHLNLICIRNHIGQQSRNHPHIFFKSYNIRTVFHPQNRKLQKQFHLRLQKFKKIHLHLVVPAATLYPRTELIEGVGGPWTLEGGDLVGELIGGFGIGNTDVPIFVGGIWSRDSVPLAVSEVPRGLLPSIEHPDSCS